MACHVSGGERARELLLAAELRGAVGAPAQVGAHDVQAASRTARPTPAPAAASESRGRTAAASRRSCDTATQPPVPSPSTSRRSFAWARCSRTFTTVSVTPSSSATSLVDRPSMSRNTTTARASSCNVASAARCVAPGPRSRRDRRAVASSPTIADRVVGQSRTAVRPATMPVSRARRALAQHREADVDRDPVQPGPERRLAAEADHGSHHAHEHLLRRVGGLVGIGEHPAGQCVDVGVRRADQRVERSSARHAGRPAPAPGRRPSVFVRLPRRSLVTAEYKSSRIRCNQGSRSRVEPCEATRRASRENGVIRCTHSSCS